MAADTYPRFIESLLAEALADTPVVCLLGPRQVGKTTLALNLPGRAYFTFDDHGISTAAAADPVGFIDHLPKPVTLDEIQRVPQLLPAIKMAIDKLRLARKPSAGQFLLTGSANLLLLPTVQESLAGRMEVIQLQPLSEQEKHRASSSLLQTMLDGDLKTQAGTHTSATTALAQAICEGGYPEPLQRSGKRAQQWYREYLQSIIHRDVKDVADIRDQDELLRLLELLATRTATLLNTSGLANELKIGRRTVEKYLTVVERLFLLRLLPPWHRNHAKRLIKTPKVHLLDSGLAAALNRVTTSDWAKQPELFGRLLESFVVQQLICQAGWVDRDLRFYHYRDKDQVEVDLVIEQGRDVWGVEIKRAAALQANDAAGLQRLATQAGQQFRGGMLLYTGSSTYSLPNHNNVYAVPLNRLWEG
jgi:uncharacterized protein